MRTLTKEIQQKLTPAQAVQLLKDGNQRFLSNLKFNRNLLQQVNETREGQHPFAVVISCMDSRTSAELIFDQGLGDIFSIRIAGNVVNEDILGSTEFGTQAVGAKVVIVLGHTGCGAIKGAIDDVDLGHLRSVIRKIQRCIPEEPEFKKLDSSEKMNFVTQQNVVQALSDIRSRSAILSNLEKDGKIAIIGGLYNISSGVVEFFEK